MILIPAANEPNNSSMRDRGMPACTTEVGQLMTVIVLNTVITLACGGALMMLLLHLLKKRSRRREVRDKLVEIVNDHYWYHEVRITTAMTALARMKQTFIFKDVSELDVFAYKYRVTYKAGGVGKAPSSLAGTNSSPALTYNLKLVERLFEVLALRLPSSGRCTKVIGETFGDTVVEMALQSSLMWGDKKGRSVASVVRFFAGVPAADGFTTSLVSDAYMARHVTSLLSYVDLLLLSDEHFLMSDVHTLTYVTPELCSKLRYVDAVLAREAQPVGAQEKAVVEAHGELRAICLQHSALSHLPEVLSSHADYVQHVRHALRTLCASADTLDAIGDDAAFVTTVERLHAALYTNAGATCEATVTSVIDRSRHNIERLLGVLSSEPCGRELTRTKLERMERDLQRHAGYVVAKRARLAGGAEGAGCPTSLYSVQSDSSIFTLARSASFTRQSLREPGRWGGGGGEGGGGADSRPPLIHASSLVSDSSVYFSPASHVSTNDDRSPPGGATRLQVYSPLLNSRETGFCETSI